MVATELNSITSMLNSFDKISLEEMKSVKLMNRTDTKYVCTVAELIALLSRIRDKYMAQAISGEMLMPYSHAITILPNAKCTAIICMAS